MKTKKVMAVLALLLAGMFVSAQSYISPEEAARLEQEMRKAERPATTTQPLGIDLYDFLWDIYFSNPVNEAHPTSQAYELSDSNYKLFDYQHKVCDRCPNASGDRNASNSNQFDHRPLPAPKDKDAYYSNKKTF